MDYRDSNHFFKYLPFNDKDTQWLIYCTTVGNRNIPPGITYPPEKKSHPPEYRSVGSAGGRVLNEFQIVYITEGSGVYKTRQNYYRIKPGTVFFVFPEIWHLYACDIRTGWHEHWVGFKGEYPESLMRNGILRPEEPVLDIGLHHSMARLFQEMIEIAQREPPGFQPKLAGSVIKLLATSFSLSQQKSQDSQSEVIVQKARTIMEDNTFGLLEMEDLARDIGISYTYFRSIFKDYTGYSPYQYFLHMKINEAKAMLQTGEYTVKEVALNLSFENQSYFSRLFKKKTGVSPSSWFENSL